MTTTFEAILKVNDKTDATVWIEPEGSRHSVIIEMKTENDEWIELMSFIYDSKNLNQTIGEVVRILEDTSIFEWHYIEELLEDELITGFSCPVYEGVCNPKIKEL